MRELLNDISTPGQGIKAERNHMEDSVSVMKYCGIFALVYAGLMLAVNTLFHALNVDLGAGANAGMAIAAACGGVAAFVKDHGRSPSKGERRKLTWGSIAASILISLIGFFIMLTLAGHDPWAVFNEIFVKITPVLFGVAFIIVTLIYYLFLGVCYWWIGKIAARAYVRN